MENKVTIERAERLTKEGIFAISLTDEEYKIFCKGKEQGRKDAIENEIDWLIRFKPSIKNKLELIQINQRLKELKSRIEGK